MKTFLVSYRRYYGELKDDFTQQFSADDELDMLFTLLCAWGKIYTDNIEERNLKCGEFLEEVIGEDWTLDKFLKKHFGLWADQDLCFEIYNIREGEIKYIYK